eukprot:gb/GECH01010401.1/.p1 GENE.gb/GECH01010401.1/~~gb/GECH01010401.1/.p1  ORF type:complete len:257 (+),score=3.29 gb/GECH01010401.1/:1-771(+)
MSDFECKRWSGSPKYIHNRLLKPLVSSRIDGRLYDISSFYAVLKEEIENELTHFLDLEEILNISKSEFVNAPIPFNPNIVDNGFGFEETGELKLFPVCSKALAEASYKVLINKPDMDPLLRQLARSESLSTGDIWKNKPVQWIALSRWITLQTWFVQKSRVGLCCIQLKDLSNFKNCPPNIFIPRIFGVSSLEDMDLECLILGEKGFQLKAVLVEENRFQDEEKEANVHIRVRSRPSLFGKAVITKMTSNDVFFAL